MSRPRVGVSTCLLGEAVRHDGGHKRDRFLTDVLSRHFEWVPVCPEVEVGMGTPRPALRLVRDGGTNRMVTIETGDDWTGRMQRWSRERLEQLAEVRLSGYILKKNSPSCGMERVKLYGSGSVPTREGVGLFARALMERFPHLPVEEEGRLNDGALRENFITRVYAYERWRDFRASSPGAGEVVEFHTRHKMLLLAHDPAVYQRMGRLVADAGVGKIGGLLDAYEALLMRGLRRPAPVGRHVNVMHHLCGFLKESLEADDKEELLGVIDDYRRGIVPLITPLTLLRHHLRRVDHPWVGEQVYLQPYPRELGLRSPI